MSAGFYPALLGAVVIDATNNTVRVTENGVSENLTIPVGVYFVRGNNGSDDLVAAFSDMLQSHSGGNVYNYGRHGVSGDPTIFQLLPSDPSINLSFFADVHQFSILFANAATTFDASLLGFEQVDIASGVDLEIPSTLSSSAIWIGNDIVRSFEPVPSWARERSRALSNKVRAVNLRDDVRDRLWVQENIEERRFNEEAIAADPDRAFSSFLRRHVSGLRFELHDVELTDATLGRSEYTAGFTLDDTYVFDDDFFPQEGQFGARADGMPHYDFSGHLLPYVA